ncbi:hypothetical protein M426DRAFT_55566 [Hypoxylon sp. CI-4A]|nr:hypothetical protein M426DRAFT_55566 [Hypoxylon sp. CI-4A]
MDETRRNWNPAIPAWQEKKKPTKSKLPFTLEETDDLNLDGWDAGQLVALQEFRAARKLKSIKDKKRDEERATTRAEEENLEQARLSGQVMECGCCFEEFPLNRMIECDGDAAHKFCRNCMKAQAETNIGLSKHELTCMSMDGCSASFSAAQRKYFLEKKTQVAWERLEQEAALRIAGIEDLETCPFCPYAAEYPPPDVDKEFRCIRPGCGKVSCRLCRKESHIPKSCAEVAADNSLGARHALEEAMSEAVIRICNSCKSPYLKLDGCNKITCTKCGHIQCYVCRKSIKDYQHFSDTRRGQVLNNGQCPLFDNSEIRHQQEAQRAEEAARQKAIEGNPEVVSLQFPVHSTHSSDP